MDKDIVFCPVCPNLQEAKVGGKVEK